MYFFAKKREGQKRRQEIDVQVVSRFVLKQRIFKPTTYTSNKNAFEEKEEKRQGGKEEERKRGKEARRKREKEEKRQGGREKKRRSEMSVFVIQISFQALFQHTE